jgi:hypothetical protein
MRGFCACAGLDMELGVVSAIAARLPDPEDYCEMIGPDDSALARRMMGRGCENGLRDVPIEQALYCAHSR